MIQRSLFDELPERPKKREGVPPLDRFQGALLCSTVGDALGWPTEFLRHDSKYKPPFKLPLHDFVQWQKLVGGKWWGYEETIAPGAYSDDTQLALAMARCIKETGEFEPERFAYEELPLWLHYERGGGRSVKAAARKLIGKNADWLQNFYKQGDLDYRTAGANGAAMRNLPIALVNAGNESRIIRDSFCSAIITHGHPRAILGTILFSLAVNYAITVSQDVTLEGCIEYLHANMEQIGRIIAQDDRLMNWIHHWDEGNHNEESSFRHSFNKTRQEAARYLEGIREFIRSDTQEYYDFVGTLTPATKGSGLATVCAALYIFLKYANQPEVALPTAANMLGSDTDTIGIFLGAFLGAYHGISAVPLHLLDKVQDHDYLLKMASRLHSIAANEPQEYWATNQTVDRKVAYLRMLAWEIGLHEMFWDAIGEGGIVYHPTIGRGTIVHKDVKSIRRERYIAKLIHVKFDCGQTCIFHSRVENDGKVSESLGQEIASALAS